MCRSCNAFIYYDWILQLQIYGQTIKCFGKHNMYREKNIEKISGEKNLSQQLEVETIG